MLFAAWLWPKNAFSACHFSWNDRRLRGYANEFHVCNCSVSLQAPIMLPKSFECFFAKVIRKAHAMMFSMVGHLCCLRESVRPCPVRHLAVPTSTSSFTWKYKDQGDEFETSLGAMRFCIKSIMFVFDLTIGAPPPSLTLIK